MAKNERRDNSLLNVVVSPMVPSGVSNGVLSNLEPLYDSPTAADMRSMAREVEFG